MSYKISAKSRCAVVGYGSWGTAIVKMLLENEAQVAWHISNANVVEGLKRGRRNPKYLSQVKFSPSQIFISQDINEVIQRADVIIVAVPSAFLEQTLAPVNVDLKDKFIVSAVKGIIPSSLVTVAEFFNQKYDIPFSQIGIISGPSHAEEVALEKLSYLTVVCKSIDDAEVLGGKIRSKYIKVSYSTDIYGVEYASVLKNIYALSVGIALGLGYGDNFIAVLTSNGAMEMENFINATYPYERNTNASAYLGDLLVTSYSQFSRNRSFGMMIGKGYSVGATKRELNMVAEGYYAAECINRVIKKAKVSMPIVEAVYNILYEGVAPAVEMKRLTKKLI